MADTKLKSYGDWIFERGQLGLPLDAPPPPGYETYEYWFKRIRGYWPDEEPPGPPDTRRWTSESWALEKARLEAEAAANSEKTPVVKPSASVSSTPGQSDTPSSFARARVLASTIAGRLGAIGSAFGRMLPVLGAAATIIHAIRESVDAQHPANKDHDLSAGLSPTPPHGGPATKFAALPSRAAPA